ncbi:MAG: hydroxysqualene dehydroxylase, partial [Nannocystaceae bacterium]
MPHVAIFGGGVSGLTTAMELAERGFEVTVYERQHWGGKVRSTEVPGTGVAGRHNLPLEHGFHFFPTFYRHLPATMSRIPTSGGRFVADNLVPGSRELITRATAPPIVMPSRLPRTLREWRTMLMSLFQLGAGVPERELRFFMSRMLQFMAMCPERREAQLDQISWWDYVGAQGRSNEYQKLIARMPSQLLLAVPAARVSARTIGHAFMGMVDSGLTPGGNIDRNLNAPPRESWVGPWVRWLGKRVKLVLGATLEGFEVDSRRSQIAAAKVRVDGMRTRVVADSYVCALPVEVARRMWTPELVGLDPALRRLDALSLTWMCGVQLFLSTPRPIEHGHVAHSDTAWALTSVSQAQFWEAFVFASHGDGRVRDLVSVIIGDWDTPGSECVHKCARDCSEEELVRELVA